MKKLTAFLFALLPALALATSSTEVTKPLFDSSTVGAGAAWTSPAVRFTTASSVEIFVDNTSGTGFRDLSMTSYYDADCATTIDSIVLRRVAYGTKPTGGQYDPGRARGYIGANPPSITADEFVLGDVTTAANTAYEQDFFPQDMQNLSVRLFFSGAAASNPILSVWDGETPIQWGQGQPGATATAMVVTYGPGAGHGWSTSAGGISMSAIHLLPHNTKVKVGAAGSGVTTRVRVVGYGRIPGTFAHQMLLPACAKFTLGAASGTARVWGFAR